MSTMSFRVKGLDVQTFQPLVGLSDPELRARSARRVLADSTPGYPDRVEMRDAEPGESLLLVNYLHQPAESPYRASHAIYVLEHPKRQYDRTGEIPQVLRSRVISLRAFDADGMIVNADLCPGTQLEASIGQLLRQPSTAYIHLHYAKFGCFACRVDRV
jgi:hypothetical protein